MELRENRGRIWAERNSDSDRDGSVYGVARREAAGREGGQTVHDQLV